MKRVICWIGVIAAGVVVAAVQAQVTKDPVSGITNFARLETTVACAGATTPAAVAEIKKMGFVAIFNLRQASEPGADIEAETQAAKDAGIKFYHLPFNGSSPDPAVVDQFLKAIAEKGNEPAFIHCASGSRAAAMWLIKRALVDKWDIDRATSEADSLGKISPALKTFALDYIQKHKS